MRDDDQHTDDQHHWHRDRLEEIITRWHDGEITLTEKRKLIAAENEVYYGPDYKSLATGERITRAPGTRKGTAA